MKKRLSVLVIILMLAASLAGCGQKKPSKDETATTTAKQTQENNTKEESTTAEKNTAAEATTPDNSANKNYSTRINISINPDADILTDEEGKVVEIVCNNEDAKTAYADLDVEGKEIEEVAGEMVKAATDAGFMQDAKPVTLTIMDSEYTGQELLDDAPVTIAIFILFF